MKFPRLVAIIQVLIYGLCRHSIFIACINHASLTDVTTVLGYDVDSVSYDHNHDHVRGDSISSTLHPLATHRRKSRKRSNETRETIQKSVAHRITTRHIYTHGSNKRQQHAADSSLSATQSGSQANRKTFRPKDFHRSFLDSSYFSYINDNPATFQEDEINKSYDKSHGAEYYIRQVPGDGGCLFHALSVCVIELISEYHGEFDTKSRVLSHKLRQKAVNLLEKENWPVYIEDGEVMNTSELLTAASQHFHMTPIEYCRNMLKPKTWGGGPEIVVLANRFKRPIHVYGLKSDYHPHRFFNWFRPKGFRLKPCAKFGSPIFDDKEPIRILCADGRFPNIQPGQHKDPGDHFLALFPVKRLQDPNYGVCDGLQYADMHVDDFMKIMES